MPCDAFCRVLACAALPLGRLLAVLPRPQSALTALCDNEAGLPQSPTTVLRHLCGSATARGILLLKEYVAETEAATVGRELLPPGDAPVLNCATPASYNSTWLLAELIGFLRMLQFCLYSALRRGSWSAK
jgi:hypothetical protein